MGTGFCWLDLAARDAAAARRFYAEVFGWSARDRHAHGGVYTRLHSGSAEVASLYQMGHRQMRAGAPSHWTPYAAVADADDAVGRVVSAGGRVLVQPFEPDGGVRIALVQDNVGALLGLWQAPPAAGPSPASA